MQVETIRIIIALILLSAVCVTDVKHRRAPNIFTFPAIIAGMALCIMTPEKDALMRFVGLLIWFALGYLRLMGMGDLKVIMALNTLFGFISSVHILLISCFCMMVFCMVTNTSEAWMSLVNIKNLMFYHTPLPREGKTKYPFTVFISAGFIIWLCLIRSGII